MKHFLTRCFSSCFAIWVALLYVAGCAESERELPENTMGLPRPEPSGMSVEMREDWEGLVAEGKAGNAKKITRFLIINEFVDEAGIWLNHMRKTFPDEAEWFSLSARHATNYGAPVDARRWLSRAAVLAPTEVAVQWELAQIEQNDGEKDAAYQRLSRLAETVPDSPYGLYGVGRMDLAAGRLEVAKTRASMLQDRFPQSPLGFLLAAAIADQEGKDAPAGEMNAEARARGRFLEPPNPWLESAFEHCFLPYALEIQGALLRERLRHEEAIALLLRGIQLAPKRAGLHFELGNAYYETGNAEATLGAYHEALRLRPDYAAVYPALAQATERFGGLEAMERVFRDGLTALPDFYYIPLQLGELELRRNRPDSALELFRRAVRLNPAEIAAWQGYAESARLMDQREEFLDALDGMVATFPDDPTVVPFAGNAFLRLQAWERLDALYARLPVPMVAEVSSILREANAALREENVWAGYKGYRHVLVLDPQNATALFNLGNLYCNYGACDRGLDMFEALYASLESAPAVLRWRAAQGLIRAAATSGAYARGHEVLDEAQQILVEIPGDTSEHEATLDELFLLLMDAEPTRTPDL